jgi:hypothetical protein
MSALVCGLDVDRDSTCATILDGNGRIVNQRMGNDRVLSYLSDYKIDRIGVEASNQMASLYRLLEKNGYVVAISYPKKTRYIAEVKIKSDLVDPRTINELVRLDTLPFASMPDQETARRARARSETSTGSATTRSYAATQVSCPRPMLPESQLDTKASRRKQMA